MNSFLTPTKDGMHKFEVYCRKINLDNNTYYTPNYAEHRPAVKTLLSGKLYEPQTHKFVERFCGMFPGSIIHAGAFFGDMLPNFANFVNGTVYAFEPLLENYILSRFSVDYNNLENVLLFNSALGEKIENLVINPQQRDGLHAGGSSKIDNEGAICTAIPIDSLGLDDIVLVQLDIEGFELNALKGAVDTIKKSYPVIAIEDNKRNCEEFLLGMSYKRMGVIPGLSIWCSTIQFSMHQKIEEIFVKPALK